MSGTPIVPTVPRRLARRPAVRAGAALTAAGAAALGRAGAPTPAAAQAPAGPPVEPKASTWRTWLLTSGSQLRHPPPPDRATTDAELRELKALAGRRDPATLDRITFWDAGPAPYRWTEALIERAHGRSPLANGALWRAFALVTVAMHDAMVATRAAKYAYNRPRPTEQDPSLTAAVAVPRSPSYPAEHAAAAGQPRRPARRRGAAHPHHAGDLGLVQPPRLQQPPGREAPLRHCRSRVSRVGRQTRAPPPARAARKIHAHVTQAP